MIFDACGRKLATITFQADMMLGFMFGADITSATLGSNPSGYRFVLVAVAGC